MLKLGERYMEVHFTVFICTQNKMVNFLKLSSIEIFSSSTECLVINSTSLGFFVNSQLYSWECKLLGREGTHLLDAKASIKGKGNGFKVLELYWKILGLHNTISTKAKEKWHSLSPALLLMLVSTLHSWLLCVHKRKGSMVYW